MRAAHALRPVVGIGDRESWKNRWSAQRHRCLKALRRVLEVRAQAQRLPTHESLHWGRDTGCRC